MVRKTIAPDLVAAARREEECAPLATAHERDDDRPLDLEDFRRELARSLERILDARRDASRQPRSPS